jgi:hypothetical protein
MDSGENKATKTLASPKYNPKKSSTCMRAKTHIWVTILMLKLNINPKAVPNKPKKNMIFLKKLGFSMSRERNKKIKNTIPLLVKLFQRFK